MATYAGSAEAQAVGSRVRVRDSTTEVIGTLLRLDADSIVVKSDERIFIEGTLVHKEVAFPVTSGTMLDMSTGRHSKGGTGALWGFGVGMAFTVVMTAASTSQSEDDFVYVSPAAIFLTGTVIFGGVGALVGYAIGSSSTTETWASVPLDLPPPGDPYEVTEGMVQLGLRINF